MAKTPRPFVRRSAPAVLSALLALGLGPTALCAQGEPPVDPALPGQLKELKDMLKDKDMTEDFRAISLMQKLREGLDQRNPKDKTKLAKGLGEVFQTGKVREGNRDIVYREAADSLGALGEDGAAELAKAVTHKRFKDNIALQAHLTLALGKTEDPKQIDWLLDTMSRSPEDELRAAAGEALGSYGKADIKLKRDIVKEMVRAWGSLDSLASTPVQTDPNAPVDFGPQNARKTLRACEARWNATLAKLTGVSHSTFADWQRWLNKNPRWEPPQ